MRIVYLLMLLFLPLFVFAACGGDDDDNDDENLDDPPDDREEFCESICEVAPGECPDHNWASDCFQQCWDGNWPEDLYNCYDAYLDGEGDLCACL